MHGLKVWPRGLSIYWWVVGHVFELLEGDRKVTTVLLIDVMGDAEEVIGIIAELGDLHVLGVAE